MNFQYFRPNWKVYKGFWGALANKLEVLKTSVNNTDKAAKNMTDWTGTLISIQNYYFGLATVYFNPELKSMSSVASWFFANFLKIKIQSWVRVLGEYKIKDLDSTYRSCTRLSYVNMLNCQKQDLLLTLCKILKLLEIKVTKSCASV